MRGAALFVVQLLAVLGAVPWVAFERAVFDLALARPSNGVCTCFTWPRIQIRPNTCSVLLSTAFAPAHGAPLRHAAWAPGAVPYPAFGRPSPSCLPVTRRTRTRSPPARRFVYVPSPVPPAMIL